MNVSTDERVRRAIADLRDATPAPDAAATARTTPRDTPHRRSRLTLAAAGTVMAIGAVGIAVTRSTTSNAPATSPDPAATAANPPAAPATADSDDLVAPSPTSVDDGSHSEPTAVRPDERPRFPTVYPVIEQQVDGAGDPGGSYAMIGMDNSTTVTALMGIASDTSLRDGIAVEAVAETRDDYEARLLLASVPGSSGGEPSAGLRTIELWGRPAVVYTEPGNPELVTVVTDTDIAGVTLRFSGLDPLSVLTANAPVAEVVALPPFGDSDAVTFTIAFNAQLPDGYSVVVEPFTVRNGSLTGWLSVNNLPDVEGNLIEVATFTPLVAWASAGTMTAVEINGTPAWMADAPGHNVMWQVNDETFVSVGGSATPDEALRVAADVTFTDEAAWRQLYDVAEPDFVDIIANNPGPVASEPSDSSSTGQPDTTHTAPTATDQ